MPIPKHPETISVVTRIPRYRPGGLPMYWRDEVGGVLPAAVKAYLNFHVVDGSPEPSAYQMEILIDFLRHYICAPCWNAPARTARDEGDDEMASKLIQLRLDICQGRVKTVADVDSFIERCLDIALDPL